MPSPVTRSELAAIVLIGGRSSRMGTAKAWLDVAGQPMLVRVVERLRPLLCEVVLVASAGQDVPPLDDAASGLPLTVVRDDLPGAGPLPALARGLAAISTEWAVAVGCDAPLLRADLVARLAEEARAPGVDAVIPSWDGRLQPLVALYRRTLVPTLAALVAAGERRVHVLAALPGARILAPDAFEACDPEGESFRAVNTPAEHAAAVAAWRREHGMRGPASR